MPSYLNFRFKFLDANAKAHSFFYQQGRIDEDSGLLLGNYSVNIIDIDEVYANGDRLVVNLRPFVTLSKHITEHIIPDTHSLLLQIADQLAMGTKSALDLHRTTLAAFFRKQQMTQAGKAHLFRSMSCPVCEATLDLTDHAETLYIYCRHCESLFNKHGDLLPRSEGYRVCPECNYYNRVQHYSEFHFYALPKRKKSYYEQHYCCDTCAQRFYEESLVGNSLYLIGLPFNIYLKNKLSKGTNPLYDGMTEANRAAQDGDMMKADELYGILLLRNERHPAVYFNLGQAYFQAELYDKAYRQFEKSLEFCSNYQPTLDFLERHKNVSWKVRVD